MAAETFFCVRPVLKKDIKTLPQSRAHVGFVEDGYCSGFTNGTEMTKKFRGGGHQHYTRTLIGGGPHGETVIFEIDKKKPGYVERLMAQFKTASR